MYANGSLSRKDIAAVRDGCERSLKYLCKIILGYKDWSEVHSELEVFMKGAGNRIHVELPRGHLKSSIITVGWVIQRLLVEPNLRILIVNATWDNSREFLRLIQTYLAPGGLLQKFFGQFTSNHWNQDAITIRQRTRVVMGPTIATTGVEKEKTSQHYDIIVVDDLVGPENVQTGEQRLKVFNYYMSLFDLLEPNGKIVVIGTRYHQADLYSSILEETKEMGNWSVFIKSAYREDGSILFPEKFTHEILNEKRNRPRGAYHFAAQYLNNPIDESTVDFKLDWIRYYDPGTPHPSNLYMTVDPALSLSRDADYTAMLVGGMFSDRRIRFCDYFRKRVVPSELVNAVFEMVAKWKLHRIGIETFAFQKTLKFDIERQQRERKIFFSIDELGKKHSGKGEPFLGKEARIRKLQPLFEQGLIEIRRDMKDFVEEIISFPRGGHDDLLDCAAYHIDKLFPSQGVFHAKDEGYMTVGWWLKNHMPKPAQEKIYERIFADLK